MFANCSSLSELELNKLDNVINMENMFYGCKNLTFLRISNSITNNYVENIGGVFYGCLSLATLDLSNFHTDKVSYISYLFYNCESLIDISLNHFISLLFYFFTL